MRDLDDEIRGDPHPEATCPSYGARLHPRRDGRRRAPGSRPSSTGITTHLRKRGRSVGIVAIDPTSPYSGGAILGDRIRMQPARTRRGRIHQEPRDPGTWGPLRSTIDIVQRHGRDGKDVILIETVGVGQDEVEIVKVRTQSRARRSAAWDDIQRSAGFSRSPTSSSSTRRTADEDEPTRRSARSRRWSRWELQGGEWKPPSSPPSLRRQGTVELLEPWTGTRSTSTRRGTSPDTP